MDDRVASKGATDKASLARLTSRPRQGSRAWPKLSLFPLKGGWCAGSAISTTLALTLWESPWRSRRLIGIAGRGPLAIPLLVILPGPTRWGVELWRGRARRRWDRRCRRRGVTLTLRPKGPLEWLKGFCHHIFKALQQRLPFGLSRAAGPVVNKVNPLLGFVLTRGICKLPRLNDRGLKIQVTGVQAQNLDHFC